MPEPLRFLWDALFRDGGDAGIWGAMCGGLVWGAVLVLVVVIVSHLA